MGPLRRTRLRDRKRLSIARGLIRSSCSSIFRRQPKMPPESMASTAAIALSSVANRDNLPPPTTWPPYRRAFWRRAIEQAGGIRAGVATIHAELIQNPPLLTIAGLTITLTDPLQIIASRGRFHSVTRLHGGLHPKIARRYLQGYILGCAIRPLDRWEGRMSDYR